MQRIVAEQPEVAWAVSYMTLSDQLELMLELVTRDGNTYLDEEPDEPLALNVERFQLRGPRQRRLRLGRFSSNPCAGKTRCNLCVRLGVHGIGHKCAH